MTGMSNGSMMAEYYAARRSHRVAAVVGVAGSFDATTRLRGAVPLLVIHGTADQNVPFNGGLGVNSRNGTDFSAVSDVIGRFAAAFGRQVQDVEMRSGVVWRHQYIDGRNKPVVALIRIDGGGHVWPGGRRTRREPSRINATQEALSFFALHP
jgi:polyhydroxybutyrate depolymerase